MKKNDQNSRVKGFFKLEREKKVDIVGKLANLDDEQKKLLARSLDRESFLYQISENVISSFPLPYSVAPNFLINNKDYFVPMVTEEPSVVAAAAYGALLSRSGGGIKAEAQENIMVAQVYLLDLKNPKNSLEKIREAKEKILRVAERQDQILREAGGGVKGLEVKILEDQELGSFIRIHLLVDVQDAMGAGVTNKMAEGVAPLLEKITGGRALLKIVSNLADRRTVKAETIITKTVLEKEGFDPDRIIDDIIRSQRIAGRDPYRAVTHNKGILNGMGAVALATGNDWRALEAAVHGFAAGAGEYKPLTSWEKDQKGNLKGEMMVPVPVGTVGGIIQKHPLAQLSLNILNTRSAKELGEIIAAVGLVQNFSALRALVGEGIQKGHRKTQLRDIAFAAGARGEEIDKVVAHMIEEDSAYLETAKKFLKKPRAS